MSTTHPHTLPPSQRVLLLHGPRQPYHVTHDYAVPDLHHDREILVRTAVIGLNPIDWKAPDFNFAIPELPYIAGRECAGEVVRLRPKTVDEATVTGTEVAQVEATPVETTAVSETTITGETASPEIITAAEATSTIAESTETTDTTPVVVVAETDVSTPTQESTEATPLAAPEITENVTAAITTEKASSSENIADAVIDFPCESPAQWTTKQPESITFTSPIATETVEEAQPASSETEAAVSEVSQEIATVNIVKDATISSEATETIEPTKTTETVDATPLIHTFLTNDASASAPVTEEDTVSVDVAEIAVPDSTVEEATSLNRVNTGDRVLAISTDYRDLRKGAYQEYVVVWDYNTVRLPPHLSYEAGATIGVAFVAAILALGVNLGVDFRNVEDGPDLLSIVRQLPPGVLAADIREECLTGISVADRAQPGDWLAIWGASSTSAHMAIQLARLAGLRVAAVVDTAKHGWRLAQKEGGEPWQPDLVVDSHDPERAVAVLRANLGSRLRFGFDTRGRDTATWLLQALACSAPTSTKEKGGSTTPKSSPPSPPATPREDANNTTVPAAPISEIDELSTVPQSHLVGLTGLPKGAPPAGGVFHNVPIKLFHEVPAVGEALSAWLERLLASKKLVPPVVAGVEDGLERVNAGLDRLRAGEISGGRLVVRLETAVAA